MPNIIRRDDAECLDEDPPPEVDPMNGGSHGRYDGHTTGAIPFGHAAAASQGDLKGNRRDYLLISTGRNNNGATLIDGLSLIS